MVTMKQKVKSKPAAPAIMTGVIGANGPELKREVLCVRIAPEVKVKFQEFCKREGRDYGWVMEKALDLYLRQ